MHACYSRRLVDRLLHELDSMNLAYLTTSYPPLHYYYVKVKKLAHTTVTERRVPEPIPVLCSQPAGDVSH